MKPKENTIVRWIILFGGPLLSLLAFVVAFFLDPLKFGTQQPMAALPAFLLAIVILLINQNIATYLEIRRASTFSDRIYDAVKNYLHVTHVGSPEEAMRYISNRIASLKEVNNTSFNIEGETERANEKLYDTDTYIRATMKIAEYSARGVLWKDIGDGFALTRFREIKKRSDTSLSSGKSSYKYRLITHNEPQINFAILEYHDGDREVLFNWDFRRLGQDPTVLISRDWQIVEMFSTHFFHLWQRASEDHDNIATRSTSKK